MDEDFDTGPILVQRAIEITPDDDVDSYFPKLLAEDAPMIPEMLLAVAAGLPGTPQPFEGASSAPLCTDLERWLDWRRPVVQLRNQMRGWSSRGAMVIIDGLNYQVNRAHPVASSMAAWPSTLL